MKKRENKKIIESVIKHFDQPKRLRIGVHNVLRNIEKEHTQTHTIRKLKRHTHESISEWAIKKNKPNNMRQSIMTMIFFLNLISQSWIYL